MGIKTKVELYLHGRWEKRMVIGNGSMVHVVSSLTTSTNQHFCGDQLYVRYCPFDETGFVAYLLCQVRVIAAHFPQRPLTKDTTKLEITRSKDEGNSSTNPIVHLDPIFDTCLLKWRKPPKDCQCFTGKRDDKELPDSW